MDSREPYTKGESVKIRKPSPAMAVACTALFISLGGTGVAAVNYARNAGAVDGKSAVAASTTTARAAGRLVATNSRGPDKGRIPSRFLAGIPVSTSFGNAFEVTDNAQGAAVTVGSTEGLGTLTATCSDQNDKPGVEDPTSTLTFTNQAGVPVNIARRVGNADAFLGVLHPNTVHQWTINGSNTFFLHVQNRATNWLVTGVVRQDGRGAAAATCAVYGSVQRIG